MGGHGRYSGTTQAGGKPGSLGGVVFGMGTVLGKVTEMINMKGVGVNNLYTRVTSTIYQEY